MAAPTYIRSSLCMAKRLKIGPVKAAFVSLRAQPSSIPFRTKTAASQAGISTAAAQRQADVQSVPPQSVPEFNGL